MKKPRENCLETAQVKASREVFETAMVQNWLTNGIDLVN